MPGNDDTLNRMTETVRSLVEIMRLGNMPAVDLVDERAVLQRAGRALIGFGEASGDSRASVAIERALRDLERQRALRCDDDRGPPSGRPDGEDPGI